MQARNVSIFIPTLGSGGAEKQAALLAKVLSQKCNVIVVVLQENHEISNVVREILNAPNIKIFFLVGGFLKKMLSYRTLLKRNKVDYVFNYLTKCDLWGTIVARMSGVKWIYNGIRNSNMGKCKFMAEYISHNYIATATIFNCYSGYNSFVKRGLRKDKSLVISNCFPNVSIPVKRNARKERVIITVGRFVPQKDYETAIRAISLLKELSSDFVYWIIGYGVLQEQLNKWIEIYNVSDVVRVYIKPNNIAEMLKYADVYLSTSIFEGTSNSIMEAMNWCLPIVATDVGDNRFLVENGETGFLHNVGDSHSIADSLKCLLDNIKLRNDMGVKGNRKLCNDFSMQKFSDSYFKLVFKQ